MATPTVFDYYRNFGGGGDPWGGVAFKNLDISNKQYTEDEANKTFDIVRNLPEYQAQQAGVGELEGELNRLKRLPQTSGDTWLKPLLALADSETGSNLLSGYQDNDVSQKRNEMILKYQDALANRQKQSADTLMAGLGKFKSGTLSTTNTSPDTIKKEQIAADLAKAQITSDDRAKALLKKKGSGKANYNLLYDKPYLAAAAKADALAGTGLVTSPSRFMDVAEGLVDYKDDLISPVGGSLLGLRGLVTSQTKPEYTALVSVMKPEAVRALSGSFKGSMSDADRTVMESLAIAEGGTIEENIEKARQFAKFSHVGSILKKMRSNFIKEGRSPTEFQNQLEEYGSELLQKSPEELGIKSSGKYSKGAKTAASGQAPAAATAPTQKSAGPKEGETKILPKSGKKAIFKGGKWQLM